MPNVVQSDQFQVVQDLLKRQDDALEQLDDLDKRVELAIKEVNAFRDIAETDDDSQSVDSVDVTSSDPNSMPKAA